MVLDNAQVLKLLVKKVFGSLLLNLDKWPIGVDACFSIGRTYFYDRNKRRVPINQAGAEKIKGL